MREHLTRAVSGAAAIRALDIALSLGLLAAAAMPAFAALCLSAIAFGRPLYAAKRIGRRGMPFTHLKLRTMKDGISPGRAYLEAGRVPPVFRAIRALRLDEYPDLARVLCGSLSLVGPRPLPQAVIDGCLSPPSADRHDSRPGVAGLAQLALARRGMISSATQYALDAAWVRRASPGLYLGILLQTLLALASLRRPNDDPAANEYRLSLAAKR